MPAITADAALVPCALEGMRQTSRSGSPARLVVGPDGEQPGQLALAAGVGLDRHLGVAGDRGQPRLELVDQREVARRRLERGERMDVGETRQADRLHLGRGVQLHGARAERDHAAVEREVDVGQPAQVAQHGRLGVVLGEDRVDEDGPAAQQRHGQRVAPAAPLVRRPTRRRRSRTASTWSSVVVSPHEIAHVVVVDQAQQDARARPRPRTISSARPGRLDDDGVEELPVHAA